MTKEQKTTKKIHKRNARFDSFKNVKKLILDLGIQTRSDYNKLAKTRSELPVRPDTVYALEGWESWMIFLNNPNYNWKAHICDGGKYNGQTYDEVRLRVQQLGIKTSPQYYKYVLGNHICNLPSNPRKLFLNSGWTGWGDFLGTGSVKRWTEHSHRVLFDRKMTYEQAKRIMKPHGLRGIDEFVEWFKTNKNFGVPSEPARVFGKKGWVSWIDFLGSELLRIPITLISKEELQSRLKDIEFKTYLGYIVHAHMYPDLRLPKSPIFIYQRLGITLGDIFETLPPGSGGDMIDRDKESLAKLEEFLIIRSKMADYNFVKRVDYDCYRMLYSEFRWPSDPQNYFSNFWKGWNYFFSREEDKQDEAKCG
jgi:hypothetical protein